MVRTLSRCTAFVLAVAVAVISQPAAGQTPPRIGIVIMHGKGGSPAKHVAELASVLKAKGYLVANPEMPWSERRSYDASVQDAESEVQSALDKLRLQGAKNLFVAGHSQGAVFALYFGSKHAVDGVIAMAPGGNVASPVYREKLADSVAHARQLIDGGKGSDKARFLDYGGAIGTYVVVCKPAIYLSWFDPDGAMDQMTAMRGMNPEVPVLFIVPTGDYPGLLRAKQALFASLPVNPMTRLYEPESSHLGAPAASADEIQRWIIEVAGSADHAPQGAPAGGRP